jgi:hypothetical protein
MIRNSKALSSDYFNGIGAAIQLTVEQFNLKTTSTCYQTIIVIFVSKFEGRGAIAYAQTHQPKRLFARQHIKKHLFLFLRR